MSEEHKLFLLKAPRQRLKSRINNNKMARFKESAIHCSVNVTEVTHGAFTVLSLTEPTHTNQLPATPILKYLTSC